MRKPLKIAAAAVALAVAFGMGAVTTGMAKPADAATIPPSCLRYIDVSGEVFGYARDHMGAINDALDALQSGSDRALNKALDKIDALTAKVHDATPQIEANARDCRAGK